MRTLTRVAAVVGIELAHILIAIGVAIYMHGVAPAGSLEAKELVGDAVLAWFGAAVPLFGIIAAIALSKLALEDMGR